jgi:uncharacterized membrane protein
MLSTTVILITTIIIFVIGFALLILALNIVFRRQASQLQEQFASQTIITTVPGANSFGQQSKGLLQVRGNGTLLITGQEIVFQQLVPRNTLRIPLAQVTGVETTRMFLGKTRGRRLLKVDFVNEQGEPDAAAYAVRKVDEVKAQLEQGLRSAGG